jgi:hypothetical protein
MNIQISYSTRTSAGEAAAEIKAGLQTISPKMVMFFASSIYPPEETAHAMEVAFPDATVFGCTTAGEIISGHMLHNSIVAMAFNAAVIGDVKVEILTDVHDNAARAVTQAFTGFEKHYGTAMWDADPAKYAGIVLVDGLSGAEEKLMEKISDLTNVNFVGASAGDDLKLKSTFVFAHGKAYTNAAVLALLKPNVPFDFIKTQSFRIARKTLTPTKVDREKREVLEFNNRPATVVYAEAVGAPVEKIQDSFMTNPLGLMHGGEMYVRSPQQVVKGNSIAFYCALEKNVDLELLSSTDIVDVTQKVLKDELAKVKHIEGLVNFHCILRTLELEKKGQTEAYGRLFTNIPTIGFSSYGEEFNRHINQTSTMLVFASGR